MDDALLFLKTVSQLVRERKLFPVRFGSALKLEGVEELVSHEFKLSDIQTAFENLEHKPKGFLKGIVVPD